MPRLPIDYSNSCVYRLVNNHKTYYVGSTTNFVKRKHQHKRNSSNEKQKKYNIPLYNFIRESGGWGNDWDMVLIESYPECKTSEELRKYERFHYDLLKPELNMIKPHTTVDERKECGIEYCKVYRDNNRDKINERGIVYRDNNRDKIIGLRKVYYDNNRDKIRDKFNEKKDCECGGKYTHGNISRHIKSKKHQSYLEGQKS